MKVLRVLIFVLVVPIFASAQTAPNISVTDVEGEQHDLYELLDDGKYVFIDFFSYWCGICCNKAPDVKTIYENFGCNTGDVIVLSIDNAGNNSQAIAFENDCAGGGGSPLVSGNEGNGSAAYNAFDLIGQPNFRLISPDRSYLSYNSSSMNVSSITAALNGLGVSEQSCTMAVGLNDLDQFADVNIFPTIVTDYINIEIQLEQASKLELDLFDLAGKKIHQFEYEANAGFNQFDISYKGINSGYYLLALKDVNNKTATQKIFIK